MIFFHGTSRQKIIEIIEEGVLWGKRGDGMSRCTYLATKREEAAKYGEIVLRVEYIPGTHPDNFQPGCWQVRVYGPIPLKDFKEIRRCSYWVLGKDKVCRPCKRWGDERVCGLHFCPQHARIKKGR